MAPKSKYGQRERAADRALHAVGMVGSILASVFLVLSVLRGADPAAVLASLVYGIGLVAMLWSSAAYHLTCHPRLKEWFRRCDHAAIFLMIAGTYTPFAIAGL